MHALKVAGFIALNIALLTGASAAADAPPGALTKISATVMDGGDADHKPLDFSCTVESQGMVIGTFNSMQASLVISRPLYSDLRMTCSKAGYEQVRFLKSAPGQPIAGDVAPSFWSARAS